MANSIKQQEQAPVAQALSKQETFLLKYKKAIVGAVVALLVIVAAVICYNNFYAGPREDKASTALAKAQTLFAGEQYEQALKGGKGTEGFLTVAENYSGTKAGNLAKLYAGLCYAKLEKWQDAIKYLEDFSTKNDALISPASQAALGNAYANTNNIDKAISCLKKAAEMADSKADDDTNNSIAPSCLVQAGRLLESQNKADEALKIYKEVKEKYVNSMAAQDIDKYIERVTK